MPFNFRRYLTDFYYSLFRSKGTPARLSRKRVFLLLFLFFCYPVWNTYIRLGLVLDRILFPAYRVAPAPDPIFIIGNYRSGSTFFHRLLLRDEQFTCLRAWEIYFAPAISHRKLIRFLLKVSRLIGSPIQKAVAGFDQKMNDIYTMHKTGLMTYEQDSQLFYHTWSSYNIFAISPFPELARRYIYYDQMVPRKERERQFGYYQGVLKRKQYLEQGTRYLAKNPDFTPAVETLLETFPNARFINLVRPPEQTVPSSINLWAHNWRAYGTPEEEFPQVEVIKEHAKHWYQYPHQVLADLPPDRYQVVLFKDLVKDPKSMVSRVYREFGLPITEEFLEVLKEVTVESRNYNGHGNYSLERMGVTSESLRKEFAPYLAVYELENEDQEQRVSEIERV